MAGASVPAPPAALQHGVPGLVVVTATVKGPPAKVAGFVERNLRAGADHVVVFVDDADPEVLERVAGDPGLAAAATVVPTGAAYWRLPAGRPDNLNRRQVLNANVANALASSVPRVAWLFHLDLDERLHVDKERLLALPTSVRAVALATWEVVSTEPRTAPLRYKRTPTPEELADLHRRGLVERPTLRAFLRGHVGKRGIRPDPAVRLRIHHAMEPGGRVEVEPLRTDWLQVLHDESDGYREFVRKWRALLSSGTFGQKPGRARVARLVEPVLTDVTLHPAEREMGLRRLYRRHVADDVTLLEELGLLVDPEPAWSSYTPAPLTGAERATLAAVTRFLATAPKRWFELSGPPAEQLLRRCCDERAAADTDPVVLAGLRAALARTSGADGDQAVSGSRA